MSANAIEAHGLVIGRDCFLAFSPERVDPGNKRFTTANIPKVVGGVTPSCTRLAAALYRQVLARDPTPAETASAHAYLQKGTMTRYAQILLSTNEEIFLP